MFDAPGSYVDRRAETTHNVTGDGVWRLPANRPALPPLYSLRAERPV